MIFGAHLIVFSADAEADRSFLAEVLGFDHVDAGGGWLIFGLPPAEVAVHPADAPGTELYLMCDDVVAEVARLTALGVTCAPIEDAGWGSVTSVELPSGAAIGLYQPRHDSVIERPA